MIVFGNHVLCLAVLFLLQSAGWMGMVQGQPRVSVGIQKHSYYSIGSSTSSVTYSYSIRACRDNGFYLLSGYTKAIRTEVMNTAYLFDFGEDIIFYIGADAEYSVHKEPDPSKKCDYKVPSLNCIYKWNQGLWANALGDGSGVGFYQGSDPTVKDASVINGYDVTVYSPTTVNERLFIIRQKHQDDHFVFYLILAEGLPDMNQRKASLICEAQDGTINTVAPTATTEAPTTTNTEPQGTGSAVSGAPEKLDDSGWSNELKAVVVVLLILLAIFAVLLCLYCCGCICRRKADDRRVPENSMLTIHTDREGSVMHRMRGNSNMSTASGYRMNPLLSEDEQDKREIRRNVWMETQQYPNALARADSAVRSDFDAAAEQRSRRRSSMRRTRSNRRMPSMSLVDVPIAGEIVEDTRGEWY